MAYDAEVPLPLAETCLTHDFSFSCPGPFGMARTSLFNIDYLPKFCGLTLHPASICAFNVDLSMKHEQYSEPDPVSISTRLGAGLGCGSVDGLAGMVGSFAGSMAILRGLAMCVSYQKREPV